MSTEDGGLFVGPGDGKELPNPIGGQMIIKVRDEDTAGAYSIHDNTIPPGAPGPRPHIHRHHEEAFYVLAVELRVRVGRLCGWGRTRSRRPRALSLWCRGVSSTNLRIPGWSQPECYSSFPRRGWSTFLRRQPRDASLCRQHQPIRRSWRNSRPLLRSTATNLPSSRQGRSACACGPRCGSEKRPRRYRQCVFSAREPLRTPVGPVACRRTATSAPQPIPEYRVGRLRLSRYLPAAARSSPAAYPPG